jgi:hypothetical protein
VAVKEPVRKIRVRLSVDTTTDEFTAILKSVYKITRNVLVVEQVIYLDKEEYPDFGIQESASV